MAGVYWADQARATFDTLPAPVQEEIDARLTTAATWPEWYPLVVDRPRWTGHRRIMIGRRWAVLYRMVPGAADVPDQIYVTAIAPATSDY